MDVSMQQHDKVVVYSKFWVSRIQLRLSFFCVSLVVLFDTLIVICRMVKWVHCINHTCLSEYAGVRRGRVLPKYNIVVVVFFWVQKGLFAINLNLWKHYIWTINDYTFHGFFLCISTNHSYIFSQLYATEVVDFVFPLGILIDGFRTFNTQFRQWLSKC